MRTRVKICGFTVEQDLLKAVEYGVDAVGLVFYEASPRAVTIEQGRRLVGSVPPFVSKVALFVNPEPSLVQAVMAQVPVDLLQFHGDETHDFCTQFGKPFMKAIRVQDQNQVVEKLAAYPQAAGFLLDTFQADRHGGTGRRFDWRLIPPRCEKPLILAGGLSVDNVAEAIRQVRPYALDVSSGVESQKGVKDSEKMRLFMQTVMKAQEQT